MKRFFADTITNIFEHIYIYINVNLISNIELVI